MKSKFIAYDLVTFFHLYSALGYILTTKGEKATTVYLQPNINREFITEAKYIVDEDLTVEMSRQPIQLDSIPEYFEVMLKFLLFLICRPFVKANKSLTVLHHSYFKPSIFKKIPFKHCYNLNVVCFEEGIGTYGDLSHWINVAKRENKRYPRIKFYLQSLLRRLCRDKYGILSKEVITEKNRDSFKIAVNIISKKINAEQVIAIKELKNKLKTSNTLLVFTSPLLELGLISEEELILYVKNIKETYQEFDIYINPHPLEQKSLPIYKSYGIRLIPDRVTAELLFSVLVPVKVVGDYSTAMLVAAHVYGISVQSNDFLGENRKSQLVSPSIRELFNDI